MKNSLKRMTTGLACAVLLAGLSLPAHAAQAADPIRVGSYKGTELEAGERSGLIVSTPNCTASSSDPAVVNVEQVLGFWTAIANAPGTATITVTAPDGREDTVTLTVDGAEADTPAVPEPDKDQTADMAARQELARLVNEARSASGAAELAVSDELMEAAQACADQLFRYHNNRAECEAVAASGYPYGFGSNLCIMTGATAEDVPQRAVTSWINSPGHYQTMIDPACDSMGVGIAQSGGITYCYLFVGKPGAVNPYG